MLGNLVIGTAVISATVLVHTLGLMLISRTMVEVIRWLRLHRHRPGQTVAMIATVLGLFLAHTVEIWSWALVYLAIGAFDRLETALYFSTTTFSTVGFGDVTMTARWRLLGALEGVNGFLLIGWSTAYLVGASTRYGPFRSGEHF